ncbi:MAG: helix-turn-helix domain-containing protein [Actinomycetota bacterium]
MSLGRLVVAAVKVEGRSKAEVARDYRISRQWVHELIRRFDAEGEAGLEPRSRRPHRSPRGTPPELEDEIVELRKALAEQGLDAGAHTIAFHLTERHGGAPAPSTIWRVLTRRGFVTPQPRKTTTELVRPVRGGPAQRALAGRHHPLGPCGRQGRGDAQHHR